MGFYNLVFGSNPFAPWILACLGNPDVGRFRDAWIERGPDGPRFAVYTRNGSGNRMHFGDGAGGPDCPCSGCAMTHRLPQHPLYWGDADDTFDSTYATVYFHLDGAAEYELAEELGPDWVDELPETINMSEVWQQAIAAMGEAR